MRFSVHTGLEDFERSLAFLGQSKTWRSNYDVGPSDSGPLNTGNAEIPIFGERHLRRILTLYSLYYNETRTHLGLAKDAPLRRATQRSGTIIVTPILSGLHHRYARI
jgi:hypothetical protein